MQPPNLRDVGEALGLWLDPAPIPAKRLLRGGKFDQLSSVADLGEPRTILNLRRGPDPTHLCVRIVHVPASDDVERAPSARRSISRSTASLPLRQSMYARFAWVSAAQGDDLRDRWVRLRARSHEEPLLHYERAGVDTRHRTHLPMLQYVPVRTFAEHRYHSLALPCFD